MPKLTDDQIRDAAWRMIAALPFEGVATEPEHQLAQGVSVEHRPALFDALRALQQELNLYPCPDEWEKVRTVADLIEVLVRVRDNPALEDRKVKPVLSVGTQTRLAWVALILLACSWLLIGRRC